jgi:hypothetical protein
LESIHSVPEHNAEVFFGLDDTNAKYIHPVDDHWTDRLMKTVKLP